MKNKTLKPQHNDTLHVWGGDIDGVFKVWLNILPAVMQS